MTTVNNQFNYRLKDILTDIKNSIAEKQLENNELDILNTYIDIVYSKKLPIDILDGEISSVDALKRVGEYKSRFGKIKSYDKYFEIDSKTIRQIVEPNKNLKITFVDLNDELGIVLHNENYNIFELYIEKQITLSISEDNFEILKKKFEDKNNGLKLRLNEDLTISSGVVSENASTITIEYNKHFSQVNWNNLRTIYLFPAIDIQTASNYKHKITFVMFFDDVSNANGTIFYDTFQICPPDGCQ